MTTVLLIQLFKESPLGVSPLEAELSQLFGSQLLAIDSFSGSSNLGYVRKMIEANDKITAVIWEAESGTIKGLQPIFNSLLKKKQAVYLITNSKLGVVVKLSRAMHSQIVMDNKELMEVIKKNESPAMNNDI